jgi:hypothetical protein
MIFSPAKGQLKCEINCPAFHKLGASAQPVESLKVVRLECWNIPAIHFTPCYSIFISLGPCGSYKLVAAKSIIVPFPQGRERNTEPL